VARGRVPWSARGSRRLGREPDGPRKTDRHRSAHDDDAGSGATRTLGTRRHRRRALHHEREPLPTRVDDLPALPPAYAAVLDRGLGELDLTLDPSARQAIDDHARLLLAWTGAINLTSIREPASVALAHVLDSLAGIAPLRARGIDRFLDLGSGGGYPGIPLAAALPAARALLIDSVAKKAGFLSVAAEATGLAGIVEAHPSRAEALAADRRHRERWPAVTARAVGSLAELTELGFPLLARDGVLVVWKRGDIADEIERTRRALGALGGGTIDEVPVPVTGLVDHRIVVVTKTGTTAAAYPRDPSVRRRRPW
jgi:16S rRNA (guanine527-N7)-methyltransferase